jgi:hypothetical protein
MQAWYEARFEREMGCTEAEWLRWLPGAVGAHALDWHAREHEQGQEQHLPVHPTARSRHAAVDIDGGRLRLHWAELPARQIALMRVPRLQVSFRFDAVDEAKRQAFMRYFDLYTQRGGG